MYFAFLIDVFSRMIVGWQLASHMRCELVLDTLRMALGTRQPGADVQLVQHTDQGSQGGFKRSSQHSIWRRLRWAGRRDGQRVRRGGQWSVRRSGPPLGASLRDDSRATPSRVTIISTI
jgi:hypothetical protein